MDVLKINDDDDDDDRVTESEYVMLDRKGFGLDKKDCSRSWR